MPDSERGIRKWVHCSCDLCYVFLIKLVIWGLSFAGILMYCKKVLGLMCRSEQDEWSFLVTALESGPLFLYQSMLHLLLFFFWTEIGPVLDKFSPKCSSGINYFYMHLWVLFPTILFTPFACLGSAKRMQFRPAWQWRHRGRCVADVFIRNRMQEKQCKHIFLRACSIAGKRALTAFYLFN